MQLATLEARKVAGDPRVVAFEGSEALCRPYRFDVHFTLTGDVAVDLGEAIGSAATLRLARDAAAPQTFSGVLAELQLLLQTADLALYRATLVPRLWRLGLTRHSRVFTKQTMPEILRAVLDGAGLAEGDDYELRLDASYQPEELVVQYQESKLDFLHRWLEHEGLYYFFEQRDEGEKLVIVDHRSFHDMLVVKTVRYFPLAGHDTSAGECFDSFAALRSATVKGVRLADYDYARPALDVSATSPVSAAGFGEVSVHGARFFDPGRAARFARLRAEQLRSAETTFHAAGSALHMSAGYLMELGEHAAAQYNTRYLVTEVQHYCNQLGNQLAGAEGDRSLARHVAPRHDEVYRVELRAIEATTQFRPERSTPWPRVYGYEAGVVDGPADSPYAQLDGQGRYLVKLMFDESDLRGGKASTYVRMMQPHGGTTEGFHFPLRKGTEVLFTFLGGDPDRPVIAGVVPNATTPSPVTDANHTQNVIQTGGSNKLVLEDQEGKQYVYASSPPEDSFLHMGAARRVYGVPDGVVEANVVLHTSGAAAFKFGTDWRIDVGGVKKEHVKGQVTWEHDTGRVDNVGVHVTENYTGPHTTFVKGTRQETVIGTHRVTDKANRVVNVTGPLVETAAAVHQAYDSQTTVVKGAWKGTYGSWDMNIRGGAKLVAPSWEIVNPTETWAGAAMEGHWGKKFEAVGFKSELAGLVIGFKTLVVENHGINLVALGMLRRTAASKQETSGSDTETKGLKSVLAGLVSFT